MAGDLLVGVSLHHDEVPPDGVDYALISPIFETRSKPGAQPLGLEGLRLAASRTQVPLFALGGITASNAADCLRAGAAGVAVREAVLLSNDPREAMKPFT
jgi:thiamine monophosphate synthase